MRGGSFFAPGNMDMLALIHVFSLRMHNRSKPNSRFIVRFSRSGLFDNGYFSLIDLGDRLYLRIVTIQKKGKHSRINGGKVNNLQFFIVGVVDEE